MAKSQNSLVPKSEQPAAHWVLLVASGSSVYFYRFVTRRAATEAKAHLPDSMTTIINDDPDGGAS
jgi:hypothetical protein